MKKSAILFAVLLAATHILLLGSSSGKYNVSKPTIAADVPLMADGNPMPPPIPPKPSVLMADGNPMPPPIPPNPSALSA